MIQKFNQTHYSNTLLLTIYHFYFHLSQQIFKIIKQESHHSNKEQNTKKKTLIKETKSQKTQSGKTNQPKSVNNNINSPKKLKNPKKKIHQQIHEEKEKSGPVIGVLVEAAAAGEDDERDLGVAEHGELVGLLEEAVPALAEGDLAIGGVLDSLDLDFTPPVLAQRLLRIGDQIHGGKVNRIAKSRAEISETDSEKWIGITRLN